MTDVRVLGGRWVVAEFRDRQVDDPFRGQRALVTPEIGPDERGAQCATCGYWGIVPETRDVVDAVEDRSGASLVCQECEEFVEDDLGRGGSA